MSRRLRGAFTAAAIASSLLLPATSGALVPLAPLSGGADAAAESGLIASPNMEHVANLKHQRLEDGWMDEARNQNGTDIEFATIDVVVGVDGDGNELTEPRDFALAGTYQNGLQIVDITDPRDPQTTAVYDCGISQGDVQVFERDGRTLVAYTADDGYPVRRDSACVVEAEELGLYSDGGLGTYIADITDPANPVTVSFYGTPVGSHNQTVAPGGQYLYNSNSDIGPLDRLDDPTDWTGRIEVIDISDLSAPTEVFRLPLETGADSHDITFNEDGTRAYTAALTHTLVLDTTDLAAPKVLGRILDPAINIHHQSDPVTLTDELTGLTRTFLVVTDELAGAAGNGVCPGGGLHIYDVTDELEAAPLKVGYWNMPEVKFTGTGNLTCTSHVLRIHPEHALMTIAWYRAGVRVVDLSGLIGVSLGAAEALGNVGAGLREVGFASFPDSDTWSAKTNRIGEDGSFYLFGNDMKRGLDVYRYDAGAPEATEGGRWLSPEQALAEALARPAPPADWAPRCLLKATAA